MTGYINTIADLEAQTYGLNTMGSIGNELLKAQGGISGIHTAFNHGHATSSPSGINANLYNIMYGQKVWSMLNRECNALSVISKRPYTSSGWRVLAKRAGGGSGNFLSITGNATLNDALYGADTLRADRIGGVPENASLDSQADGLMSIAPEYDLLNTSPKIIAHQFEFSELAMEMAAIDDGIGDIRAQLREDMGKHHSEVQNAMLVMPLEHYQDVTANSASADVMERNYTSLLKIVSSNAELTEMAASSVIATRTDDINRLYGKSRASDSFLDAQVSFGAGYTSGEARQLTLTVLNSLLRDIRVAGGSPKVILTGYDTLQTLSDLLQAQ